MTDIDDALAGTTPEPVTATTTATPRKCRHEWLRQIDRDGVEVVVCTKCWVPRDPVRSRRGRQSRNYGNSAAPEGLHKCWCQHGYAADSQGIPPMESPTPPESAEALRDLTFEQAATKALAIAFHRAEGRCRGHYAPRCGEECDRFAERVGPTLAVWLGWYGIAAARATPPLTVEALAKAMESLSIHGRLYVTSAPLDTEYEWDEAAAAILAALTHDPQGREDPKGEQGR